MSNINLAKMQEQEQKDFNITLNIMTAIFNKYNAKIQMEQKPIFSPYDASMKVEKGNKRKNYIIEIKERNQNGEIQTLPLKVKKYCNIMAARVDNETPIAIYLCNDKNFYIFDLSKIDLNKVEIKNWNIPKVQYTNNKEYEEQPTFFIPISLSTFHGTYANNQ